MDQEENHRRMEAGSKALSLMSHILEPIHEQEEKIIQIMLSLHRSGTATHDDYVKAIAGIDAMRTLLKDLEYKARQGELSAEQEIGNG